jgi:hypothetical protein
MATGPIHAWARVGAPRLIAAEATPTRTLHQDPVTRGDPGLGEQHAVRRAPGDRQAGGLVEGQPRGLRDQVAGGHGQVLGEGPVVPLGQQRTVRVHRLVAAAGVRIAEHRIRR